LAGSTADRFIQLLSETRVYAVTDDALEQGELFRGVEATLRGGVRLLQYRDKLRSDRERVEIGIALRELVHGFGGMLIMNDRVDLALAIEADGAHVGQDDLPIAVARRLLGPDRVLGASASYLPEIAPAIEAGVDYLGFGAVFATGTKPDAEFAGLELLAEACRHATVPVVGIGGISLERAPSVMQQGVSGVAVVTAISRASDPESAASALIAAVGGRRPA
jgi:thiamine-phosphate pyrophosphorylase